MGFGELSRSLPKPMRHNAISFKGMPACALTHYIFRLPASITSGVLDLFLPGMLKTHKNPKHPTTDPISAGAESHSGKRLWIFRPRTIHLHTWNAAC